MHIARAFAVVLCSVGSLSAAFASDSDEHPAASSAALTRADAEAWLDGFLTYELQRGDIAGGVVVIVKDGEVLLQKGYGYPHWKALTLSRSGNNRSTYFGPPIPGTSRYLPAHIHQNKNYWIDS